MVDYHPFSQQVIDDPQSVYRELREHDPCFYLEEWDCYFLSRFEDIWEASMDGANYSTEQGTTIAQLITKVQPVTPMLNNMNPPRHTKMRSQVATYFTPGKVRKLEPQIRQLVDDAYEEVRGKDEVDLFNDFANQVSVKVACLANGFPMEDSDMLNGLVWRFFGREEGVDGMTADGVAAMTEMFGYFAELIMKRRAEGVSDGSVVDLIIGMDLDGDGPFDIESAGSHLSMFLIGGAETFPKTFASLVHRLWEHPDQRAELVKDPSLIPGAYQEGLRYDMPTQFLMRQLLGEVKLHDKVLKPGQNMAFLYPSANRDPREFDDPDTFDIRRGAPRILSFGHGVHACIGQHFAKLEGRLCMEKLLAEAPDYEVKADRLKRIKTEFVQGWETMPVVLSP